MSQVYSYQVEEPAVRLDRFIAGKLTSFTRSYLQKLINSGHIKVNERLARPGLKLRVGDRVEVMIPPPPPTRLVAEAMPLKVLFEDEDIIVIDKPAGVVVHPAPGQAGHTISNAVLAHYPALGEIDDSVRPGIVHRLDKDTSGVMVIAKNKAAQLNLVQQFKSRLVAKTYLVLVKGRMTPEKGIIEAAIGRNPNDRKKMAIVSRGREARSEYRVIRYLEGYSLLEVSPKTGRTHQIRVHLAAVGFPVVGDAVYGVRSPWLKRQFLHAFKLGLKLPSTGQYMEFTSELPPDLHEALDKFCGL